MLTNYHTLAYVAASLQSRLLERIISDAFSQERDQLVLRFEGDDEALIASCDRLMNTLFLRSAFSRARANSVNVLPGLVGKRIVGVGMHPVDRVVMLRFFDGTRLDAQFFGAKANVFLLDGSDVVLDAFKDAKHFIGTKPQYRSGEILYDIDALRSRLSAPQLSTLSAMLKNTFPTLGTTLVNEILHRANLSGTIGAMSVGENDILAIQRALSSVLLDMSNPQPRVYFVDDEKKGAPSAFSIIPLSHLDAATGETFADVHEAIRLFISQFRSRTAIDEEVRSLTGKLNQKLQKARRTIDAVESDMRNNSRADDYQRFGDVLMENLHLLRQGDEVFESSDKNLTIPLAKELSPAQNAQKYFERAKRSRAAQRQARDRLVELQEALAPLERLLHLISEIETKEHLKQFMAENENELEQFGIGKKSEQREQLPFRVFTVDGGFEVWAGKSSKNNDELTMKHAKPNDLWFHARGSAGSHVVLKVNSGKGEPGKKAKEQAASIAAYYSKMKNAKMVPVAMTEKKYVRKPKGSAPGSVAVEREKVIFAEPALPQPERG